MIAAAEPPSQPQWRKGAVYGEVPLWAMMIAPPPLTQLLALARVAVMMMLLMMVTLLAMLRLLRLWVSLLGKGRRGHQGGGSGRGLHAVGKSREEAPPQLHHHHYFHLQRRCAHWCPVAVALQPLCWLGRQRMVWPLETGVQQ